MAAAGGSEEIGEKRFLSDEVNTTVFFQHRFSAAAICYIGDRGVSP